MARWITGDQETIEAVAAPWAVARIGQIECFKDYRGLALFDEMILLAAVIYTDFNKRNLCMHVASDGSRRWLDRRFLREAFAYPFETLGCARVTGLVAAGNAAALRFDKHLGFRFEGRLRHAHWDGSDLIVLGMLRQECRWLKENKDELRQGLSAVSA